MHPPELQSIANELTKRYGFLLKEEGEGGEGLEVAELLTAEEQVKAFVHGIGQSMLQTFVDVRILQAKASRQHARVVVFHLCTGTRSGRGRRPLDRSRSETPTYTVQTATELLVDFYADHFYGDHFYGEAVVEAAVPGGGFLWLNLIITGDRSGAQLDGMIIDRDAGERWFDATFEAPLVTASESIGTVQVASDDGSFTLNLHLWRISPCGCETSTCTVDTDCPQDHTCQDGTCVEGCTEECCSDTDCPTGQACQDNQCVDPCATYECCLASDCVAGDDCVNGTCKTPCTDPCACELGEACVAGYCQAAE